MDRSWVVGMRGKSLQHLAYEISDFSKRFLAWAYEISDFSKRFPEISKQVIYPSVGRDKVSDGIRFLRGF